MKRTIAIDFDGTLFESEWPEIGKPIWPVIQAALKEQENGSQLILWTNREDEALDNAILACSLVGLRFDAVNASCADRIEYYGTDPRKVGADEYWDDRAVNVREIIGDSK